MNRQTFLKQLPGLVKSYKPSPTVTNHISNLDLVMIIGPSGVGKTSVIKSLGLKYVPAETTHEPRSGEREGKDFYFRNDYDQIASELESGQFVQVAVDSGGDLKATKANYYPSSGTVVMAIVTDVVPTLRQLGFKQTYSAFVTPPSYEEWMRRLRTHSLQPKQLQSRLAEAKRSLSFALNDKQMHFILNEDIGKAVAQVHQLLAGKIDKDREQTAQSAAEEMLNSIN